MSAADQSIVTQQLSMFSLEGHVALMTGASSGIGRHMAKTLARAGAHVIVAARRADKLDCEFIATGHYANVREENSRYIISKGIDTWKDQSYVLWGVSQESLARTKLPLGYLKKSEIREMATQKEFYDLVNKKESYEICFVPDNDYRGFLKRRVEGLEERVKGGNFVLEDGKVVGKHEGYPFYTIGQRKGLGIAFGTPMFVTEIRKDTNEVVLGHEKSLDKDGMMVGKIVMQKYADLNGKSLETNTKIRYKTITQ
jgi:tRNA-specific 2-thiouridylase